MKMLPPTKNRYQSPPIMQIPGMPSGPFTPGEGGMSPGQLPTGGARTMQFIDANNNGVDDRDEKPPRQDPSLTPIKQAPIAAPPPMTGGPMPPPPMGTSDDLFGAPGAGTYDNLMSRSFQEYSSGQSPYEGASSFLMNRPAFDRGARPETSMPSTDMPSYSYSDPGGAGGLAQLQAQQPGIQAQYDQFAQQIQSAQEAAQQQAQQQTDMAASERQALMDRIAALEGQEGPDLDAFGSQLRQDILGEIPEQIDIDALRREITGEVLSVAQQEFPDVTQIRDEVMRLLPEPEQVDVENLRRQIQESIDRGAPPEQIDALRQELQNRIRPVEEQLQGLQESRGSVAEQIGELRGQVGALPDIDVDAIRQQIISQLPEQERVDIESLQRRIQDSIDAGAPEQEIAGLRAELNQRLTPVEERVNSVRESVAQFRQQFDPSSISEQIGNLRGRLEGLPNIDIEDIRRRVAEGIDANQTTGINPDAQRQIEELRRRFEEGRGRMDPDVEQITEQVRGRINPDLMRLQESLRDNPELARLREESQRLREEQGRLEAESSARASVRAAELSRLRADQRSQQAASERAIQEVGGRVDPLAERLAQLRGRLDERPTIDQDAIARRVRESITPQKVDVDALRRQIQEGIKVPTVDLGGIREQIGQLRGRLDERPQLTSDAVQRMIKESMANRTTAGIKPQPQVQPRVSAFPPGYRGGRR